MAKKRTGPVAEDRLETAVQCEGKTSKNERCKRKTRNIDGNCRQCKGEKKRAEKTRRRRETRAKRERVKAQPLEHGTVTLLGTNLNTVCLKLYQEADRDVEGVIRRISPYMVEVRSLSPDDPFVGCNLVALAIETMNKNYESSLWDTARQWRKRGGKIPKGVVGTRVLQQSDIGVGHLFPTTFTVYNEDQVVFKGSPPSSAEPPPRDIADHAVILDRFGRALHESLGIRVTTGRSNAKTGVLDQAADNVITLDSPELGASPGEQVEQLIHSTVHLVRSRLRKPEHGPVDEMKEELIALFGTAEIAARFGVALESNMGKGHSHFRDGWYRRSQSDRMLMFEVTSIAGQTVAYMTDQGVLPKNSPH